MASYSVADARNNLSKLIDRALEGEGVVISRHGAPVVELRPVTPPGRVVTAEDLALLDALRFRPEREPLDDAGALVSRMRDEGEH